jgi:hypothetical protein
MRISPPKSICGNVVVEITLWNGKFGREEVRYRNESQNCLRFTYLFIHFNSRIFLVIVRLYEYNPKQRR